MKRGANRPWAVFPPITLREVKRLPRGPSYSPERDSGRCLIALRRPPTNKKELDRVLVRNCYTSTFPVVVENMREWMPGGARAYRRKGICLERLQELGFQVVAGPFMVEDSVPNIMAELDPLVFAEVFAANPEPAPTSVEARRFAPDETPLLRAIKLHWRQRCALDGWTADRVSRLCQLMGLTQFELAELIQWAPGHMDALMNGSSNRVPGPVAIWFTFLENFHFGVSVFPDLPEPIAKAS